MLSKDVEAYLDLRRKGGYKLETVATWLRDFATLCEEREEPIVRADLAIEWCGLRGQTPYGRARRLAAIIRFAYWARAEDQNHEVPNKAFGPVPQSPPRIPFVFRREDIEVLVAGTLQDLGPKGSLRPHTYATLFALVAVTGMRIGEALRLRLSDVSDDGLVVRHAKFDKSRLVPLHPTACAGLDRYLDRRRRVAGASESLFVSLRGRGLAYVTVQQVFQAQVRRLGFHERPGAPHPRLHDLRHSFAIRALEACPVPASQEHIEQHTIALFTYLGHRNLRSSYWYLSATLPVLRGVAEASEDFVRGGQA
jgi:integrase